MSSNIDSLREEEDRTIASFEEAAENAAQVQEALLKEILETNASCEYLYHTCGLRGRTDTPSFKLCVPVITHSHILPYIQRIMDGDRSPILMTTPVRALSRSSGTSSGQAKYVPFVDSMVSIFAHAVKLMRAYHNRIFRRTSGSIKLAFASIEKLGVTKGGVKVGFLSAYASVLQRSSTNELDVEKICNILGDEPEPSADIRQTIYCQLLLGLVYHKKVESVGATFAYTLAEAFGMLQLEWEQLCEDIRLGRLCDKITDPSLRANISENVLIRPLPDLAHAMKEKFCHLQTLEGHWLGAIPLLWPNCKYISAVMTGSMERYVDRLKWYAGSVPLVGGSYAASEGAIGINMTPKSIPPHVSFTLVPSFAYYEFIPYRPRSNYNQNVVSKVCIDIMLEADIHEDENVGEPLTISQLNLGEEYEIVLTTCGGLYRYCLQDVVRVTGFFKSCPKVEFVSRANVILSVAGDMNTENDLVRAVNDAARELRENSADSVELVDFTSYADRAAEPGHYVIFWELSKCTTAQESTDDRGDAASNEWLVNCATLMERAFARDAGYLNSRRAGAISPLKLCVVEKGTFSKILDYAVSANEASINQYKVPRLISSPHVLAILRNSTSSTHYSSLTRGDMSLDSKLL